MAVVGCEKDKDSVKLSDFIIGEWLLPAGTFGENYEIVGIGTFNDDGTYNLSIYQDLTEPPLLSFDGEYSVNNGKNELSLQEPDFDTQQVSDNFLTIKVTWQPAGNIMTWNMPDNDQVITLTRQV
jgi:hypothetical protein